MLAINQPLRGRLVTVGPILASPDYVIVCCLFAMRFGFNEITFSQRSTTLSNSLQEFVARNFENLDRHEYDSIICFVKVIQRKEQGVSILGTARRDDASMCFRNKLFVHPERDGESDVGLFAHQRNLVYHFLESEEFAILQALGFRRNLDELTVATDTQIRMLNGDYYHKDELMQGTTELYLYRRNTDPENVVLVAHVPNTFGNRVKLFAEPFDSVQTRCYDHGMENGTSRALDHEKERLLELIDPWYVNLQFNRYVGFDIYYEHFPRLFHSTTWKLTHVMWDTVFDTISRIAVKNSSRRSARKTPSSSTPFDEDEIPRDFDVLYSSSNTSTDGAQTDDAGEDSDDEVVNEESEEATASSAFDPQELDSALAQLGRNRDSLSLTLTPYMVQLNSFGNLPYLTEDAGGCLTNPLAISVHEFTQLVVPRGYMNTVLMNNSGTGKCVSIISQCMFNDSRNNWIFVKQFLFDRWLSVIEKFKHCRYHLVVTFEGLKDFVRNFDRYSTECNVIVIDSALAFSRECYRNAKAHRVFYCDQRYTRRPILYGSFNYLISWKSRYDWFADRFYSSHMTVCVHSSCIDRMYDLPAMLEQPIYFRQLTFGGRGGRDVLAVGYNPNSADTRRSQEVIDQLLAPEHERRATALANGEPVVTIDETIAHLREKMTKSSCMVCLGRDHDYYIMSCCRNPICIACAESMRSETCPACRARSTSLVCFMLPLEEITENSILFRDYRSKSQVLINHLKNILKNRTADAPKILIVNYQRLLYRKLMHKNYGYMVYQLKQTDLRCVRNFVEDKRPAVMFCPCKNSLTGLDLSSVSHLFIVERLSCREATYLLSRVQRYPRRRPLVIRQMLQKEEPTLLTRLRKRGINHLPTFLQNNFFRSGGQYANLTNFDLDAERFI